MDKFTKFVFFLITISLYGCKEEVATENKGYTLTIAVFEKIGDKADYTLNEELKQYALPISPKCVDSALYLPDISSNIVGIGWNQNPKYSLYVENVCTPTQITSNNCNVPEITKKIKAELLKRPIGIFATIAEDNDSIKILKLIEFLNKETIQSSEIYILNTKDTSTVYPYLKDFKYVVYNSKDSIRNSILNKICVSKKSFTLLLNPPKIKIIEPPFVITKPPIIDLPPSPPTETIVEPFKKKDICSECIKENNIKISFESSSIHWTGKYVKFKVFLYKGKSKDPISFIDDIKSNSINTTSLSIDSEGPYYIEVKGFCSGSHKPCNSIRKVFTMDKDHIHIDSSCISKNN